MANENEIRNHGSINKRPYDEYNGPDVSAAKKRKKSHDVNINLGQRNPVAILNELRTGLQYKLIGQLGPVHAPVFKFLVIVDGQEYTGEGGTKKKAKSKAAENALKSFIQFPNNSKILSQTVNSNIDFTSDSFESKCKFTSSNFTPVKKNDVKQEKGPVMLLNELHPSAKYDFTTSDADVYAKFKVIITINGASYTGTGSSKRYAKNAAARVALNKLLSVYNDPSLQEQYSCKNNNIHQELADFVGRMVTEKFGELMNRDPIHSKRKVLAGIVVTKSNSNVSEVVAVTTGTKCISGEHISMNGAALNDMHAEIVARRCLINYLYDQMEILLHGGHSIFLFNTNTGYYRLKDGVKFHLYINTAPCGDARIFSPHEDQTASVDRHPNRKARGQLRTKIESGEGTIPVNPKGVTQTWDGILQGERLLTMSCSDKIARWNVLGLQGSLLSHFVEPIYLDSIILGSLLHETHLYRAICGRIENTIQGLPPPFRLNRPWMSLVTSSEVRRPAKAPNFSVNWIYGCNEPEIVNTFTGKTENGEPSRLCKHALFKRFIRLQQMISNEHESGEENYVSYSDAKESVNSYMVAKEHLVKAFLQAGLGSWVTKPIEQDQFEMRI